MIDIQSKVANLKLEFFKEKIKTEKMKQDLLLKQVQGLKSAPPSSGDSTDDEDSFM